MTPNAQMPPRCMRCGMPARADAPFCPRCGLRIGPPPRAARRKTPWLMFLLAVLVVAGGTIALVYWLVPGRVDVNTDTPRDTIESMHRLIESGEIARLAELLPPDRRADLAERIAMLDEAYHATESLAETTADEVGPEQAALVRKRLGVPSPLRKAVNEDGAINWDKVVIREEGDQAWWGVDYERERLVRVDGQWYLDPDASAFGKLGTPGEEERRQVDRIIAALEDFEEQVDRGEVDASNFDDKFHDSLMSLLLGK